MFRRKRKPSDFRAEIEAHMQIESERLREQGLSEEEARAATRRSFGNVMQTEERFYESGRWLWWDHLRQDLRFGLRTLAKKPGFAAVAVLTLALGIAINATMFSLVSAFLLRRPPGQEPERVVVVTSINPTARFQADANPISAPNYLAWREAIHLFADTAAADEYGTVSLTTKGQAEALRSATVSPHYFSVLGVAPVIGRTFATGEDQPGHDHVVILSHELWERRFGSDPSILQQTIRLNRENYDVVGVMPADFRLLGFIPQLWIPLTLNTADQTAAAHNNRSLYMFARLKPGATLEQAKAEVNTLAQQAAESFPESEKGWGSAARTLPDFLIYGFGIRTGIAVLMTTVGFVLMIACANVAGLLLSRAAGRRKELAIRISLGAGKLRIVWQLLTEAVVIALLGGAVGVLIAYWGIHAMAASLSFNEAISAVGLGLDWNVVIFTAAVSLACALLCGLVPALNAARTDINTNLKDESRAMSAGRSQNRLRTVMVTGEIALALFLLVGTGLLLRWIFAIEHQNLGFRSDHLLTAAVNLDDARYKGAAKQLAFVKEFLGRGAQIPRVETAAVSSELPATGASSVTLRIKDQPEMPTSQKLSALDFVVSPEYFQAVRIPLLQGRTFRETDNETAPSVVIVNQQFVHKILLDQYPLGKQVRLDVSGGSTKWSEIVGVVGNVKVYSEDPREEPEVYEAFLQRPVPSMSLMLLTQSDPNDLIPDLRKAVAQADAELPLSRVNSMAGVIERQKGANPLFTNLLASFAVLALVLAAIGIYGLVAFSVGQRTHEIGIRMAMGARSADVLRMILWQGMKMTVIGTVIGLSMALVLPKVFEAIFVGMYISEVRLYFIVPPVLFVVTMLATYIPARRALTVDPMVTLRHE